MTRTHASRAVLRGRPLLFALGVAALAAGIWALWPRGGRPPHVLLITIDTLRADAVGEDTVSLEALAARGRRFLAARTPVPLTLPAHATILSGLLPAHHGLRDNTAPALPPERGFSLLAEEFREAGYATAAFVASAVLDRRYGLDAGFDEYRAPAPPAAGAPRFPTLDGEEQVRRVLRWLEARPPDRPFFVWVHLWEPHEPYRPWAGDERRAGTAAGDPPAERYRGEVRRADAAVEAILAGIDRERTLVVVASDHGESLGEHGERTHGHLCYSATLDVPLVLAGPGVPPGEERRPCSLEDLAPTLRRLCGLDPRPGDGRDLLDLPRGRTLVGESLYANRLYGWAQQTAATDGRFSLIDGGPRLELYDRRDDPAETRPLPNPERHPAYEPLDRAIHAYRTLKNRVRHNSSLLAVVGSPYGSVRRAQGGLLLPAENRRLRDVREGLGLLPRLYAFQQAVAVRDAATLRRLRPGLEEWAAADPGNPAPCLALGRGLLLVLDEPAGALRRLEEAVRRGYREEDLRGLLEEARRRSKSPPR